MIVDRSGADAEGAARQAPSRAQIHAGQVRVSRRPAGAERPADAGCDTAQSVHRTISDAKHAAAERGARQRACARRGSRDVRGDRPDPRRATGRRRRRRRTVRGRISRKRASIPTCRRCISSPARSRRRGGPAASTPAFSRSTPRPSRTRWRTWSIRTRNWSNWSGCRSPRPAASTCRPSPAWCCRNWKRGSSAGFGHDLPVPFYRMPRKVFFRDLIS